LNLDQRCGEATPSGACLSVVSVVPTTNGEETSNVDVVRGVCGDPSEPLKQTAEPFRDHDAVFTLRNDGPVSVHDPASYAPAVVIERFDVSFQRNTDCQGCPELTDLHGRGPTVTVLGGQEVQVSLPMMPLRTKLEFIEKNGDADQVPSYSAVYQLHGKDPVSDVTIEGATTFTIGNFDYCEL
jgi:hypothetical protein